MRGFIISFFIVWIGLISDKSHAQMTNMLNLCHLGNTRIDVFLELTNNDIYLYTDIFKDKGFYVDAGSECILITVTDDTINLIGLNEGQAETFAGKQNMMNGIMMWRFSNRYLLNKEQIEILRSTEIKLFIADLVEGKIKIDVTPLRDNVLIRLFKWFKFE